MPRRDPETGKYVSGDRVSNYLDLEMQSISSRLHLDANDVPAAFPVEESISREPANGLSRTEEAELVALRVHTFQATIPGTSTAESALEPSYELSLDTNPQLLGGEDQYPAQGAATLRGHESDIPDLLWFTHLTSEGGYKDGPSGTGAGPDQPVLTSEMNYLREFGSGPVVTGRDNIFEHFNLGQSSGATIENSEIDLYTNLALYWDVRQRD